MTVTQVHEALGSFEFELLGNVPRDVLDNIQYFGHIAIIPGRMDPRQYGDGCLSAARYVGVVRKKKIADDGRTNLIQDDIRISGCSMNFWLGDEDGKGAVIETEKSYVTQSFSNVMTGASGLMPPTVTAGDIYTVVGSYSGRHLYETPRAAIKYVCETMSDNTGHSGTGNGTITYRVNNDGTFDAGPEKNMVVVNPTCIIMRKGGTQGEDMFVRALPSTVDLDIDMEDFSTRVVMLAESDGESLATGSADIATVAPGVNVYKDLQGNTLSITRLVSESETIEQWADVRAELALREVVEAHRTLTLNTEDYDIHGSFEVGDYVWVYDPDAELFDLNNEVYIRGVRINPMKLQVVESDWPVQEGYTVAYRDKDGNWMDLTDYVHWEEMQPSKVTVGNYPRALNAPQESVPQRLGVLTPADNTVPGAPTWVTPFSGSTYLDTNGVAKAAVTANWNTPLNVDSSTITDGDHYEINLRKTGDTDWATYNVAWGVNQFRFFDLAVGTQYDIRIRLWDRGANVGAFSSTHQFTTTEDTVAPSTPAAPTVAASMTAVQVTHSLGKSSGGTFNLEQDLAYLEVHQGSSSGFATSNATVIGTILANSGNLQATVPVVATFQVTSTVAQWFKVIAVDMSGNKSNASTGASATASLIDDAHISDLTVTKVTAGTVSANWLLGASIRTAASGARVELNSTGFQAYDSGSNNTVNITNSGTFSLESPPSSAATPVIEFVSTSEVWNTTSSGTTFVVNRPPDVVIGDLMLAFISTNSDTASPTASLTGWTQVGSVLKANDATTGNDTNLFVFKKTYALDDLSAWEGTTSTATYMQSAVVAYRGTDTATNQFVLTPVFNSTTTDTNTIGTTSSTNTNASAWRITVFSGMDTVTGGTWTTSQSGDAERSDTEVGSASLWNTLAIYDSQGTVTATSHSATGTFTPGSSTNFVSAVAWMAFIKPLPTSSSRIEMDHTGIRAYNQVDTKTLEIAASTGAIDLQGSVSSFNYAEGSQGWRIDGGGGAQFENLNTLGTLSADTGNFLNLYLNGIPAATEEYYEIKFPCVKVARESAMNVQNNNTTKTLISWTSEYYQRNVATPSAMHDTGSNPSRLIAPVEGIYNISWHIASRWTAGAPANSSHIIEVWKNAGGTYGSGTRVAETYDYVGGGAFAYMPGSIDLALSAGDYVEFFSGTNTAGTTRALNIDVGQSHATMRMVSSLQGTGTGGTNVFTSTFNCTGCRSFQGSNTERPPNIQDWAYQGYYSSTYGNQKSMLSFDYTAIQAALSGKTITACKLRFHVQHSYYSTMEVIIGTHNNTSITTWTGATTDRVRTYLAAKGGTYVQSLSVAIGQEFQAGTAKGIVFGPGPANVPNYYGYITGYQPSTSWIPQLQFTYQV